MPHVVPPTGKTPKEIIAATSAHTPSAARGRQAAVAEASDPNSREENLGSQLLSAVVNADVVAAAAVFMAAPADAVSRLANAIDWRGKSVLMHAASRNHEKLVRLLLAREARPDAADYSAGLELRTG